MEGGGEGMVAIISGLQNAGLAVTLTGGELPGSNQASIYAPRKYIPLSVGLSPPINEGTNTTPVITNVSSQVCDDRYTSSYQMAHCNKRPSSPPVLLSEFPPRKDASKTDGNFRVGYGSGELPVPPSCLRAAGTSTYKPSLHYPYRGCLEFDNRSSEAFAASLRRYSLSPVRTPSAELVRKLISYTLNKNTAAENLSTKATRSSIKERVERKCKDKDVQTYVRTRHKPKIDNVKSGSVKRMRLHSPDSTDKSPVARYKYDQVIDSYDYLKQPPSSPSPPTPPGCYSRLAEVRYLSDVSKCVKDTIKQIVEEQISKPAMCTQMQHRYLAHRKKCLRRASGTSKQSYVQAQASIPASTPVMDDVSLQACLPSCPFLAPRLASCYCDSKEEFGRQVSEKIAKWLLGIPAYANMSAKDKQRRIDMVEQLANAIVALKDEEDIEEKARKEIEQCLQKLPMWLPSSKSDKDDFKKLITDNLMNKLKKIFEGVDKLDEEISKWVDDIRFRSEDSLGEVVDKDMISNMISDRLRPLTTERLNDDDFHEILKNEIVDILKELPVETVGKKEQFLDNLAEKLTNNIKKIPVSEIKPSTSLQGDDFDNKILEWIKEIKFKKRDSLGQVVDEQEIANTVAERLKSLALNRPEDDDEYHEVLKNEIIDILEDLPIEVIGSKDKLMEKLANKLTNTIEKIPASKIQHNIDKIISQWITGIKFKKKDSQGNIVDKHKIAHIFSDRLKSLAINRPEDDEEYHEVLKNEIVDIFDEVPIEIVGNKEQFVDKLASKLTNLIEKVPTSEIKPEKDDEFDQKVSQWIGNIKFKKRDSQGNVVDKKQIADTFSERLKSIAIDRPDDDEEYHEALKQEIVDILDELPIVSTGNREQFIDKQASNLTNTIKKIPTSEITPKSDLFDKKIAQWIGDIKFKKRDSQGNVVDKKQIADTFSERLKSIAIDRPDDDEEYHEALKQEIVDILDELPIVSTGNREQFIDKQASNLTNTIKKIPTSEITPKSDLFDKKIAQWIGDIKFKKRDSEGNVVDKKQIADTFSERLKSIAIDRPDDDEEYHEALKQEIVDILDELPIVSTGNREQFIDKQASNLTNTIKKIPTSDITPKSDLFDKKIAQWIGDLKFKKRDSQGNVVDKKQIADTFSERLKSIAIDRPDDDEEYHEALKQEIVDILDELPIVSTGNREQFIDKQASNLTNTIKKIPTSEITPKSDLFDKKIAQWIGDIKFKKRDSEGNLVDKKLIADAFSEKLKSIVIDRPEDDIEYQDALKHEIINILDELPIQTNGNKEQYTNKLASKLTNMIKKIPASEIRSKPVGREIKNKFENKIIDWLKDIPELSSVADIKDKDNKKLVQKLVNKLHAIQSTGLNDKSMNKEIQNWMQAILEQEGSHIDQKSKSLLAAKLIDNLTNERVFRGEAQVESGKDLFTEEISDWLENIPELSGNSRSEKNKMIESLANIIQLLKSKNALYDADLQNEIISWMDREVEKKGIRIDYRTKENLANNLTQTILNTPKNEKRSSSGFLQDTQKVRSDEDYKNECSKEINSWLENIPELFESRQQKNLMAENLARKLHELQSRGVEDVDAIQDEIANWLLTESEKKGLHFNVGAKDDLIYQLATKIAKVKPPVAAEKLSDSFSAKNQLNEPQQSIVKERRRASIKSEPRTSDDIQKVVKNTLDDFDINNAKEVEKKMTNLLKEQVSNGLDTKSTRKTIKGILKSTNLSNNDVNDLTTLLTLKAIDLSSDTDAILPSELTNAEREQFESNAISDITEFIDDMTGDMDPNFKRKVVGAAQKLAERLGDVLSDPNKTVEDKVNILNKEVESFLNSLSVSDQYGPLLARQLRDLANRSTPRQSEQSFSFTPKMTSSKIDDKFISTLENTIQNWILGLPIDIRDKSLIRNTASDLANDIADRQKYLRSHPDIKQSEEEKLEFLKYQVFRALGKSVEANDLGTIMNETASLLREVKEITSPTQISLSDEERMNEFLDEISKWVSDTSADIRKEYLDNHNKQNIVKELANIILIKLGQNIDNDITEWLTGIVKNTDKANIKNLSDDLKYRLIAKGLIKEIADATSQSISGGQIQQDTSQFLEENLSTGITDWLKSLPLYQRRTSTEKRAQESIIQDLIKDMQSIILSSTDETDIDVQILQVVKKHLEKFPMDIEVKSDKAYIEKIAAQLVDYLHNMQLFDNISLRKSIHPMEYLVSTMNDWLNSIPIDSLSFDPRQIDETKMSFLNQLNLLLKDPTQQNDQIIKDEIKRLLETLPIARNKSKDPKFIANKVEELFSRIMGTPFLSKPGRPTINRDLVESAVQDWSEKLPVQSRRSISDKIQTLASDISNTLKDKNVTAVDNYKDNLLDKTVDFLKLLPIQNLKSDDLRRLGNDLLTTIKNKAADLSPIPVSKNAADTLYDNIATWCDDLPISEGNTPEEKERVNTMKQNLASRLVNKIGELNMNPEIFNDDFLYENLLQEEVDDLLRDLPPSPEIENNLQSIKENLVTKIREAKEKTKDELAGQTYKQQLRETISKSLPYDISLSSEAREEFEVLVDNLADAYIDLHFVTDNKEQKEKYKTKIADEITKYCNDYLKRHPEAPLDSIKINQDLYNALKSIPTPKDDIIRSEAGHVRIKDEINDWMKELPLAEGLGPQQAQKNKMSSVLAKKLLEIEKEKEVNPEIDYEEKAHKEISKLLKKLPIKPGKEADIDHMTQKLIDKLKDTEQSRRISASTTRQSIDLIPEISDVTDCPCHRKNKDKTMPSEHICPHKSLLPKSTLSVEDRAHLERIRIRTSLPTCRIHRVFSCKDASVNPPPIDTASQTDVCPNASNICPRQTLSPRTSPCQQEVSPQVIIKEYLWDSENSKLLGPVYRLPCVEMDNSNASVPSLQRPLQKSVSIQPSPCLIPPCQKRSPCPPVSSTPRPCINIRSPCSSPLQLSAPKPCINLPRTVIPSLSGSCENRSVNTVPCEPVPPCCTPPPCAPQEIPCSSTPRRAVWPRVPCFPPSFSKLSSPNDTESDAGPSRCFPRIINLGSFDDEPKPCPSPCQRRRTDYNNCQDFRRKIYRMPIKPCVDETRCYKCQNRMPRNVCRQRAGTPCQPSENVRLCPKCCGMPCPHPTGFFFR